MLNVRNFAIISIMLALVSGATLNYNRQTARDMRQAILAKDEQAIPVTVDVENLRQFVFTHMNSSIRFELVASYDRAVAEAQAQANATVNGEIYAQAQAACDRQGRTTDNARCVQEFLERNLQAANNPAPTEAPDESSYQYEFISPIWTPDIAGLTMLGTILATMTTIGLALRKGFQRVRGHTLPAK